MKITPEHFEALRAAVQPLDTPKRRQMYESGRFYNAVSCKDFSKRYRWDLLYASRLKIGDGKGVSGLPLYEYLNDEHIDTALRKIVPDLQRQS